MLPDRVRMSEEDKERLVSELEHILTVGHGDLKIEVADRRIVSWHGQAQWELRTNGAKKG